MKIVSQIDVEYPRIKLEAERGRLEEMVKKAMRNGIDLYKNKIIVNQSKKVDELSNVYITSSFEDITLL